MNLLSSSSVKRWRRLASLSQMRLGGTCFSSGGMLKRGGIDGKSGSLNLIACLLVMLGFQYAMISRSNTVKQLKEVIEKDNYL